MHFTERGGHGVVVDPAGHTVEVAEHRWQVETAQCREGVRVADDPPGVDGSIGPDADGDQMVLLKGGPDVLTKKCQVPIRIWLTRGRYAQSSQHHPMLA